MNFQEIMHNLKKIDTEIVQKEEQIRKIEEEKQKLLIQKKDILSTLNKFNTFDIDSIGNAIAQLLSVVDRQPYVYYTAYRHLFKTEYDVFGKYSGIIEFDIPIKIILPEKHKKEVFRNDEFLKIPLFIVLDANTENYFNEKDLMKLIKLYNGKDFILNEIKFNNIPDDYYTIIEEFVTTIRDYRLEKNNSEITEEEIIELLTNYTSQYEFEPVSYIKKIKRQN